MTSTAAAAEEAVVAFSAALAAAEAAEAAAEEADGMPGEEAAQRAAAFRREAEAAIVAAAAAAVMAGDSLDAVLPPRAGSAAGDDTPAPGGCWRLCCAADGVGQRQLLGSPVARSVCSSALGQAAEGFLIASCFCHPCYGRCCGRCPGAAAILPATNCHCPQLLPQPQTPRRMPWRRCPLGIPSARAPRGVCPTWRSPHLRSPLCAAAMGRRCRWTPPNLLPWPLKSMRRRAPRRGMRPRRRGARRRRMPHPKLTWRLLMTQHLLSLPVRALGAGGSVPWSGGVLVFALLCSGAVIAPTALQAFVAAPPSPGIEACNTCQGTTAKPTPPLLPPVSQRRPPSQPHAPWLQQQPQVRRLRPLMTPQRLRGAAARPKPQLAPATVQAQAALLLQTARHRPLQRPLLPLSRQRRAMAALLRGCMPLRRRWRSKPWQPASRRLRVRRVAPFQLTLLSMQLACEALVELLTLHARACACVPFSVSLAALRPWFISVRWPRMAAPSSPG